MDDGIDFTVHTHTRTGTNMRTQIQVSIIQESEITSVMTMVFAVNARGTRYA